MFKIFVNDGNEMPLDDIFYIIAKDGIFLKKKIGIVESLIHVDKISILENVESFAKLHIDKIPLKVFAKVLAFFKEVYSKYRSESVVLLFYNQNKKKYIIHIPEQEVSAASIDYKNEIINYRDYDLIGTIHSHANFGAFHSSTDSFDEKHFDGLHITIGNVNDEEVSISCSIVVNGERFKVEPEEYIENIKKKENKIFSSNVGFKSFIKYSNSDRYIVDEMPKNVSFLKRWLSFVKEKEVRMPINMHGLFPYYQYGFDYMMLPGGDTTVDNIITSEKVDEIKKDELSEFEDDNDDFNPCLTCIYRDYKIDLLMDELSKGIEEPEEESMDINYKSIFKNHYYQSLKEKENHK